MTYSLDFRQKVFTYKAKKELTFEQTSEHFDIGIRTLFRWQSNIEPCSTRNKPATKIDMEVLAQTCMTHRMIINGKEPLVSTLHNLPSQKP